MASKIHRELVGENNMSYPTFAPIGIKNQLIEIPKLSDLYIDLTYICAFTKFERKLIFRFEEC